MVTEFVDGKPEGFWVEIADAVIRIADLAGSCGAAAELVEAVQVKHHYNASRPHRHGGKRA